MHTSSLPGTPRFRETPIPIKNVELVYMAGMNAARGGRIPKDPKPSDMDSLIAEFTAFGGDKRFLDWLKSFGMWTLAVSFDRESAKSLRLVAPLQKSAAKLRTLLDGAVKAGLASVSGPKMEKFPSRGSDGKVTEWRTYGTNFDALALELDTFIMAANELTKNGQRSAMRRGPKASHLASYFWMGALAPYIEFVSGRPNWVWIQRWMVANYPAEEEAIQDPRMLWRKTVRNPAGGRPNPHIETFVRMACCQFLLVNERARVKISPAELRRFLRIVKKHAPFLAAELAVVRSSNDIGMRLGGPLRPKPYQKGKLDGRALTGQPVPGQSPLAIPEKYFMRLLKMLPPYWPKTT